MLRLSSRVLHLSNITVHYFLPYIGTSSKSEDLYPLSHCRRGMATDKPSSASGIPHEVRTAAEPRQDTLHPVRLSRITQVSPTIRLLRLTVSSSSTLGQGEDSSSASSLPFFPGQWLDVHIPSIPQAGGFTITSTPAEASYRHSAQHPQSPNNDAAQKKDEPYLELAVQNSPKNPPAAWLWRPESEILGKELRVRVGGSFVWPPPAPINEESLKKVVFVAGGVGINPIISILSHIYQGATRLPASSKIYLLYSSRLPETGNASNRSSDGVHTHEELDHVLFVPQLRQIIRMQREDQDPSTKSVPPLGLDMYITNTKSSLSDDVGRSLDQDITRDMIHHRRITPHDLRELVDDADPAIRTATVSYVCGPPNMTDEFVETLKGILGSEKGNKRVFYEKWW